eukprot:TRINITY_DN10190_c0_g1_i1.p1 TRINITY_DN10190_c0_g1~~TRINITY_DN10190_c0_g1_i1.p1  ORF type:complete len:174 (+),score=36.32 TRINITY_DN10190_c0_g1_i1:120-641(+)
MDQAVKIEDLDPAECVGMLAEVKTDKTRCTGHIFALEKSFKLIVLKSEKDGEKCDLHALHWDTVKEVYILDRESKDDLSKKMPSLERQDLKDREQKAVETVPKIFGIGVSPRGQAVFDHFRKMYPTAEWDNQSIVIRKIDVRIDPPYEKSNISAKDKDRIGRMLEQALKKITG